MVSARAKWEALPTSTFGLDDPNVSALAVDADDLWVGTWSGGLARYAWSDGSTTVFREGKDSLVANTVRAICVTSRHVWVGTDQGLSQYSKALSQWRSVAEFGGSRPKKVQAVREIGGEVYVATLGDGLWVLRGDAWERLAALELPTAYITCIGGSDRGILVGTMDRGLLLLGPDGAVAPEGAIPDALTSRNITAVGEDSRGTVWVATYGEGLWEWDLASGAARRYDVASGQFADDWVMCMVESGRGMYFGTFGGGVSFLSLEGAWSLLGLADGLGALDVMVALVVRGDVYFGTLGSGVSVYHEGLGP
jgi:ligand-binding sensor domain-containing protein